MDGGPAAWDSVTTLQETASGIRRASASMKWPNWTHLRRPTRASQPLSGEPAVRKDGLPESRSGGAQAGSTSLQAVRDLAGAGATLRMDKMAKDAEAPCARALSVLIFLSLNKVDTGEGGPDGRR